MPSIVIELDPERLADPDLDLRYEIPALLATRAPDLFVDRGYDYTDTDAMQLFLDTPDLFRTVPLVFALLEDDRLHGNHLALAATVAVAEVAAAETTEFRVIAPEGRRHETLRRR